MPGDACAPPGTGFISQANPADQPVLVAASAPIGAAPNGSSIGVRVINETSGDAFDAVLTTDIPATTTFLTPRNYLNNDTTAAAVAFDCAGVYIETDF